MTKAEDVLEALRKRLSDERIRSILKDLLPLDWTDVPFTKTIRAVWHEVKPKGEKCSMCDGSGVGQPIASGFESAGRINAYLMKQPCSRCKGTGMNQKETE